MGGGPGVDRVCRQLGQSRTRASRCGHGCLRAGGLPHRCSGGPGADRRDPGQRCRLLHRRNPSGARIGVHVQDRRQVREVGDISHHAHGFRGHRRAVGLRAGGLPGGHRAGSGGKGISAIRPHVAHLFVHAGKRPHLRSGNSLVHDGRAPPRFRPPVLERGFYEPAGAHDGRISAQSVPQQRVLQGSVQAVGGNGLTFRCPPPPVCGCMRDRPHRGMAQFAGRHSRDAKPQQDICAVAVRAHRGDHKSGGWWEIRPLHAFRRACGRR